jgi:hypothetical protein
MPLETLSEVRAVHDIQRGQTIVVKHGSPGRIVNQQPGWLATTYTVEFAPVPGGTVTLVGLTEGDVQPG